MCVDLLYALLMSTVFRSQLSRKNDFYPYEPPLDEECEESGGDLALESRIKLCRLCGCPGQKACSRCHAVIYCSKEHQTIDWKHSHKKECCKEGKGLTFRDIHLELLI